MTEDVLLFVLLLLTLGLSLILVLTSAAAFGRVLADLEYQNLARINGVRRIQSHVNLRMHGNRVLLGLVFGTLAVLALIDMPGIWRVWAGRVLLVLLLSAYAASSVFDWFAERRQVALLMRDERRPHSHDAPPEARP